MTNDMPAPLLSPILKHLRELHREISAVTDGEVATYIPELAKADPRWFGICVVTTNGGVYEIGDARQEFTIQSISKPFVYGLALEDHGRADVLAKVGVEPTGDAFNSISLDPVTGRPRNPMINAGAIASTGLIEGLTPQVRLRRILEMFAHYAGRELAVDAAVYASESATGHCNRAIGQARRARPHPPAHQNPAPRKPQPRALPQAAEGQPRDRAAGLTPKARENRRGGNFCNPEGPT